LQLSSHSQQCSHTLMIDGRKRQYALAFGQGAQPSLSST